MKFDYAKLNERFAHWPDFDKQLDELIKQHQLAEELLTKDLFAQCIKQMIAAGDFTRYIRVDNNAQQVTYEPYKLCQQLEMEVEKLKAEIKSLEETIKELKDPCTC